MQAFSHAFAVAIRNLRSLRFARSEFPPFAAAIQPCIRSGHSESSFSSLRSFSRFLMSVLRTIHTGTAAMVCKQP